jgi:hypothetical protein
VLDPGNRDVMDGIASARISRRDTVGNLHLSRDRAFLAAAEALAGNIDDARLHIAA